MSLPGNINQLLIGAAASGGGGGGYEIERSLRFNSADNAYLSRTPSSASNRRTWTWSGWVKRGELGSYFALFGNQNYDVIQFRGTTDNEIDIFFNGTADGRLVTNKSFRDVSAWYHIVVSCDTTQTTASDRLKLYVNGAQETSFATSTYPTQNYQTSFNAATPQYVGATRQSSVFRHFQGYLTEVHFIDGQQLAASDFGEYNSNNVWQPKDCKDDLTYGTNGFYLKFDNNNSTTALGLDSSGNNNDFTVNNFSVSPGSGNDSLIDTPTNYTAGSGNNGGNYCTFNPLHPTTSGSSFTNANLEVTVFGGNDRGRQVLSTLNPGSGKYYFEITPTNIGTTYIGLLMPVSVSSIGDARVAGYRSDGLVFKDGTNLGAVASTYAANDVIGVAYDIEGAEAKFYKNGTLEYTVSGITSSLVNVSPGISCDSSGGTNSTTGIANFGQRSFSYTPPTDHLSICTKNLATPTISDGSDYFDIKLYTGTGTTNAITGFDFSPDWVWTKQRGEAASHALYDSVRGAGELLRSNENTAEVNVPSRFISFDTNGYTIGSDSIENNASGKSFVAWCWDAGSSNTTISAGGLNSSVYNTSHAITSNLTNTIPFGSSNSLSNWFNGQSANKFEPSGSGSIDFSSVSALQNFSGTLQFAVTAYNPNSAMQFTINASSDNLRFNSPDFPASGAFPTQLITIPVTSLETLDFVNYSGSSVQFWGMYLDGKLLVDSTATPDNVPSIASTVRANPTAGFSIISYTGTGSNATIGHGLNAAPEFIVVKDRDNTRNWAAGHNSPTWEKYFHLNLNSQQQDSALVWQDTAPTSSVFSVGTSALINGSGNAYIAYCFAPVEGYSAFGSYTGNALADGPFVYTGFRPAFLLIKIYDGDNSNWLLLDSARDTYNVVENNLYADENSAENQFDWVDFLSNGFKVKNASLTQINGNGYGYMYAAFAENPFQANGGIAR